MFGLFGAGDRNNDKRKQEIAEWNSYKKQYNANEELRVEKYSNEKERYENAVAQNEKQTRLDERRIVQQYDQAVARQDYEFDRANDAYKLSLDQAEAQVAFNAIAENAALMEQQGKNKDNLLSVMFDESDTFLEYGYATTGLKINKRSKLAEADFTEASVNSKYAGEIGNLELERRKERSNSQIETQKMIIEGMKAAGQIRSRGNAGRSSTKAVLGVMAESGAMRAQIANGLMYAEQGIDLGIAQLKDMLILDQTMVLAARDMASTDYEYKGAKLDGSNDLDKIKISATRQSIADRNEIVKRNISNARRQADMNAANSILLAPTRLPELTDPKQFYAEYDDPQTEDYVEMLLRPMQQDFPEYQPAERLEYEKDFHYKLGRENQASSNFGDVLKIGGMVAGGIGAIGATGALSGLGMGASTAFGGSSTIAGYYSTIGAGLTNLSSSFYPSYNR